MRNYLRVLARYWTVVVAGLALGLAASIAITLTATPSYASQITFFLSVPGSTDPTDATEQAQSYVQLLTTERLSADVIAALGRDEDPAALADRIDTQLEADTALITARVTDTTPGGARELAQALGVAFLALMAELEQPPAAAAPPEPPAAAEPSLTATVVQPATLSPDPVSPVPARGIALGAILGLLAGIAAALALNATRGRIRSSDELAEATGAGALGGIWDDPAAQATPLAIIGDPDGSRAEGYRAIRTRLLAPGAHAHRTVAVVSPERGDGRTATACNLAVALAHTGRKVALLDGDVRGPGVMDHLGREASIRVEAASEGNGDRPEALTGALSSSAVMRSVRPEGIDVVEARQSAVGFSELLSSPGMATLINELADSYDVVIVDTAALLRSSDGPALAALCETTVMVVRHGQTTRKDLVAATDLLSSVATPVLGAVLNRVPRSAARPGRASEPVGHPAPSSGSTGPVDASPERKRDAELGGSRSS